MSEAQYMAALAEANRTRLARADLKRDVRDGRKSAAEIVLDPPWEARRMTIFDLLTSQRRWARIRARKLLEAIPCPEGKLLEALTERQRQAIARCLGWTQPNGPTSPTRS